MSNFTVISDDEAIELRKLREFYKEVADYCASEIPAPRRLATKASVPNLSQLV